MAEIQLKGISKSFDDNKVIKSLDLSIANGEFITVLGPSGCGKSTLLRIIAGLESQSSGDVIIDGREVNKVEPVNVIWLWSFKARHSILICLFSKI